MNTTLSPFIFAQDSGKNLIIDTQNLIVAQIITGPNKSFKEIVINIPDYHISIDYVGSLIEEKPNQEDIILSLNKMKDFFITEKLLKNEKYYSRHKTVNFSSGNNFDKGYVVTIPFGNKPKKYKG